MMYLSKEATNKDQSLKMQTLLSLENNKKHQLRKFVPRMVFWEIKGQILLFLSQISPRIPLFIKARFLL